MALSLFFALYLQGAEPRVSGVFVAGDAPFSKEKALKVLGLENGDRFEPQKAQNAAEKLRKACIAEFHPMARVTWQGQGSQKGDKVGLLFQVDAGPKGRLLELGILGNTAIHEDTLLAVLKVKPRVDGWMPLLKKDALHLDDLEADRLAIESLYKLTGRADVRVESPALQWLPAKKGFRLTWTISHEGPVYRFSKVLFTADIVPPREEMDQRIFVREGERYDPRNVERTRSELERFFLDRGHAFARVTATERRLVPGDLIEITLGIQAGPRPHFRKLIVEGNQAVPTAIIRREFPFQEGAFFDERVLRASHARLAAMPLFAKVDLSYEGSEDLRFWDARIRVRERKTGRVEGGIAYGDAEGAAFQFNLSERNLRLWPPFRGGGLDARLGLTLGDKAQRVETGITQPRLGDSLWSLDGSVRYENSQNASRYYDLSAVGFQILAGHPVAKNQQISIGYSFLANSLENVEDSLSDKLEPIDEDLRVASLVAYWNLDTSDSFSRPTRGVRARLGTSVGLSALGGNVDVIQSQARLSVFHPLLFNHVISLQGGVDNVQSQEEDGRVPVSLRRKLGGTANLRGFEYQSVTPRDEDGFSLGGETAWWATAEYRVPLNKWVDLALFTDIGDVSSDNSQGSSLGPVYDAGIGFVIHADNFPVRFDIATPLKTFEDDSYNEKGDYNITFSIGYRYF